MRRRSMADIVGSADRSTNPPVGVLHRFVAMTSICITAGKANITITDLEVSSGQKRKFNLERVRFRAFILKGGLGRSQRLWLELITSDSSAVLVSKAFDCAAARPPHCSHILWSGLCIQSFPVHLSFLA